jgi:hypothetical protein
MEMTDKEYAEFKALCKEKGISYETEAEYKEAARDLLQFVKLSYDLAREHYGWEQRLKDEPKGFAIASEGRSCCLCHTSVFGEVWYDKWGMKCMTCQSALNKKNCARVCLQGQLQQSAYYCLTTKLEIWLTSTDH